MKRVWFLFKWTTIIAVVAAAIAWRYIERRWNETVREQIQIHLARQYPRLAVSVRSAEIVRGKGVRIRGLSLREPGSAGKSAELAHLDEVLLACDTDPRRWLQGLPPVKGIIVKRPRIFAARRPDGSWSIDRLATLPQMGSGATVTQIEDGTLEIVDGRRDPPQVCMLRDIRLTLAPIQEANAQRRRGKLSVRGDMTSDRLGSAHLEGSYDPVGNSWALSGQVDGGDISPDLCHVLAGEAFQGAAEWEAWLTGLRAKVSAQFRVDYDSAAQPPLTFDISGQLSQGRLEDPRLPFPLTDVKAGFQISSQGSAIRDLSARNGQTTIRLSCERSAHNAGSPSWIACEGRRVVLDPSLWRALPGHLQEWWFHYLPSGEVDLDVKLAYDGSRWRPEITVRCIDTGFTFHKFPYRLEHGSGALVLTDDILTVNLTAFADREEVRITGKVADPGPDWSGAVTVSGDRLRFDEALWQALPKQSSQVMRSLSLAGTFNLSARFSRTADGVAAASVAPVQITDRQPEHLPEGFHRDIRLWLNRCSVRCDRFAYPLNNVRGSVTIRDDVWNFRDLSGTNGTALVTCNGSLFPSAAGKRLVLEFDGRNVVMDEELRDALSPSAQRLWQSLRPRGTIDVTATVRCLTAGGDVSLWVDARPVGDTAAIEPVEFPYRLEKIHGDFSYHNSVAEFKKFRGEHARTTVAAEGRCHLRSDGGWDLRLDRFDVDRLTAERDLVAALPERMRKAVLQLRPFGLFHASGALEVSHAGEPNQPPQMWWDLAVDAHQAGLTCGPDLRNVSGGARLAGGYDGKKVWSGGEMRIDSVTLKDVQLTDLLGPIWFDDSRVLLGGWVEPQKAETPRRSMTAKLCGGTAYGDLWVLLGPSAAYNLRATVVDADLARFSRELVAGRQRLSGKLAVNLELRGRGPDLHQLGGRGNFHLQEANIYELPLMVQLLKFISVRPADTNAFTDCDMDYRIEGEHIYFDRIKLTGNAISLRGTGEMNLNRELRLLFHTMVGRDEMRMPIFSQLAGGASQQLMQIHVGGTLDEPEIRKEPFPAVNQALQQLLQADLQGRREDTGSAMPTSRLSHPGGGTPARR